MLSVLFITPHTIETKPIDALRLGELYNVDDNIPGILAIDLDDHPEPVLLLEGRTCSTGRGDQITDPEGRLHESRPAKDCDHVLTHTGAVCGGSLVETNGVSAVLVLTIADR